MYHSHCSRAKFVSVFLVCVGRQLRLFRVMLVAYLKKLGARLRIELTVRSLRCLYRILLLLKYLTSGLNWIRDFNCFFIFLRRKCSYLLITFESLLNRHIFFLFFFWKQKWNGVKFGLLKLSSCTKKRMNINLRNELFRKMKDFYTPNQIISNSIFCAFTVLLLTRELRV